MQKQTVAPELLRSCDSEPVQFIGMLQPTGALVIANGENGQILQVSNNLQDFLGDAGASALGKNTRDIFPQLGVPQALPERNSSALGEITFYARGGRHYYEIEPISKANASDLAKKLRFGMEAIARGTSWEDFLHDAAAQTADVLGYDRVMVYRFHPDDHGEVIAEALRPGVESFLGLHYPASDIPAPARKVFFDNWVRMIPDIEYTPVGLTPPLDPGTGQSPDLSLTAMRAVSPIHLEYLRNMGVRASLTVSIKSEGRLWGLIACHHLSPRYLDLEERAAAEVLGRFISVTLRDASKIEEYEQRKKLKIVNEDILGRLRINQDVGHEILHARPNLLDLIQADGSAAALYVNGAWDRIGQVPADEEMDALVEWMQETHPQREIFCTDKLPLEFPRAEKYREIASGVLALSIPKTRKSFVLLFRPERIQTVRWAGNPDGKTADATGRLHPRASFAEWKDSVRNRSEAWQPWELDAARDLRTAILAADLQRQFEKEQEARQEAERAMRSREELMAVLSHDLKNPIGSISLQAALMERSFVKSQDTKNLEVTRRILRATKSMNTLINDILHVTSLEAGQLQMERKSERLIDICQEVIDMLAAIASHTDLELRLNPESIECSAEVDRERVVQVLSNLIGNALKFTPPGGEIEISVDRCGPEDVKLSVSDTGPGIPPEHHLFIFDRFWQANQTRRLGTGLGLAICKGIVEAHGGKIWVESREPKGTIFHFTLPLAYVR
ncbi:MAG: GAF domain-containing protein [Proteobacteria bacterium]|nr:MAG: GAF domain-containing protein [Pseudomonadota bacterium]